MMKMAMSSRAFVTKSIFSIIVIIQILIIIIYLKITERCATLLRSANGLSKFRIYFIIFIILFIIMLSIFFLSFFIVSHFIFHFNRYFTLSVDLMTGRGRQVIFIN